MPGLVRPCPGHPGLCDITVAFRRVGRDKPGHDEVETTWEREPLTSVESTLIFKRRRLAMSVVSDDIEPLTFVFEDDGLVPNNPMPFLVYKHAVDVDNAHPEKT